ncbi:transposable element Tcb1 transposase [Trichonephila clavipes]|nr:transposable element Tcb1 transposase [Trichonephila clavipes]
MSTKQLEKLAVDDGRRRQRTTIDTCSAWRYESRFNLWGHDGRIHVRRYAGERWLPDSVIERHSGLTPGVMQDNARPQVAKTVRDFCSAQHIQLLPWPAYSPDMSPIEYVWDSVGRRLARDPRPADSKGELLLRIQAIWNSLPTSRHSKSVRLHAIIAALGGYTEY